MIDDKKEVFLKYLNKPKANRGNHDIFLIIAPVLLADHKEFIASFFKLKYQSAISSSGALRYTC